MAEANVWQVTQAVWVSAALAIFLDYSNTTHYLRIIPRCLRTCRARLAWKNIRPTVKSEWHHLKLIYMYAEKNRKGWQEQGGISNTRSPVIRCDTPLAADRLLACISG